MWNHLYVATFQILSVCTANICRSPATETFLRHDLADVIAHGHIAVDSFGTHAIPDRAACDLATALVAGQMKAAHRNDDTVAPSFSPADPAQLSEPPKPPELASSPEPAISINPGSETSAASRTDSDSGSASGGLLEDVRAARGATRPAVPEHASRQVTEAGLRPADLVLALDREHRSSLARILPGSRPKTFTLRQAAVLATHVRDSISVGELPLGAPPMPAADEINARLRWLVAEMDAARGMGSQPTENDSPEAWHPLDVPDPHVIGYQIHTPVVELIRHESRQVSYAIQAVLRF